MSFKISIDAGRNFAVKYKSIRDVSQIEIKIFKAGFNHTLFSIMALFGSRIEYKYINSDVESIFGSLTYLYLNLRTRASIASILNFT